VRGLRREVPEKKRCFVLVVVALVFVALCAGFVLAARGWVKWLAPEDVLSRNIDAIFVFEGDSLRINFAAEIASRCPKAIIVCSANDANRPAIRRILTDSQGVRIRLRPVLNSTIEEVRWLHWSITSGELKLGHKKVVLVSKPTHMRRISMMVNNVLKHEKRNGIHFYTIPVPYQRYGYTQEEWNAWWRLESLRTSVASELAKIAFMVLIDFNPVIGAQGIRVYVEKKRP